MSSEAPSFADVFAELEGDSALSRARVREVFDAIFAGAWSPAQVAGLLVALRFRGTNAGLVAEAASSMRRVMVPVEHGLPRVLDTCGTGGDHSGTLNLSTGAALIAAAAGIPVAKHGNRAATSQSGSADVLEALGVRLDVPAVAQAGILRDVGITFLFAQAHHPAMRHAMPVRRELRIRTIFNCLGPLCNPAGATHQLLGVFDDETQELVSGALSVLGVRRAWVVRGTDGLDEISPYAPTKVIVVEDGATRDQLIAPEDFGLSRLPEGAARGADPKTNAEALERVLAGEAHPASDAFLLNGAAALVVAEGIAPEQAAARARQVLASGAALALLDRWREATEAARKDAG